MSVWIAAPVAAQAELGEQPLAKDALAIEAPRKLELGRDTEAEIRVRAPDGVPIRVHTNVGELSELTRIEAGLYRAVYKPPSKRFPQVAIIAVASEDGEHFAFQRIELYGAAVVEIDSEPRVQVEVHVGEATFGPVRADRGGRARLAITVPPGPTLGSSVVTDAFGNQKEQPLELGVPPFSRVLAVCPKVGDRVLLFVVDELGAPDSAAELDIAATRATPVGTTPLAPGVYRLALEIPRDAAAGEIAGVSVAVQGTSGAPAQCQMEIPLELPDGLALELSSTRFSAASTEPLAVRLRLHYPGLRDPAEVGVELAPSFGKVAAARARTSSSFETVWQLPAAFGGRSRASITARAGALIAREEIRLEPGRVARLRATLADESILADGKSVTTTTVSAVDAHDNAVDIARLSGAAHGTLAPFRAAGNGRYRAEYRSPLQYRSGHDTLAIREVQSGATTSLRIRLNGLRSPILAGVRGGYASNFARVAGPFAAVLGEYRLPFAARRFSLGIDASYQHSSRAQQSADARDEIEVRLHLVPLLARAAYTLPLDVVELSLLIGAGVVFARTRVSSENTGSLGVDTTSFAWSVAARAGLAVGPGAALLELGYLQSTVDVTPLRGNLGGAQLAFGYALDLPL